MLKKTGRFFLKKEVLIFLPLIIILIDLAIHQYVPDKEARYDSSIYYLLLIIFGGVYFLLVTAPGIRNFMKKHIIYYLPMITIVCVFMGAWDLVTLKSKILPLPYFPGPEKMFFTTFKDWAILAKSVLYSLRLEVLGFVIGGAAGVITGILIGWSQRWNYWIGPVIKVIGPIPATAWIPLAMVVFPGSFYASVFLVAFAVWFPVTVMTSSGVANVNNAYFELAKTLGANSRYLITKIAIPAAGPTIFMSLYAGLGTSFAALVGAEMLGAKAGLGWYITWRQGWAEYGKVYGALFLLGVLSSSAIYLVLKTKDKVLVWQKGLIRW